MADLAWMKTLLLVVEADIQNAQRYLWEQRVIVRYLRYRMDQSEVPLVVEDDG